MRAWPLAILLPVFGWSPMNARAEKPAPSTPPPGYLEELALTDNYTLGRPFHARFTQDGRALLFLRSGAKDRRAHLFERDLQSGEERLLVSAEALLEGGQEQLSVAEKAARERKRIRTAGFTGFEFSTDGTRVLLKLSGKLWLYDRRSGGVAPIALPAGDVLDPRLSPDGKRLALVLDHELYVGKLGSKANKAKKDASGPEPLPAIEARLKRLSKGGGPDTPNGLAEFVAQEEMGRFAGYWWAPDGSALLYQNTDQRHLERFTIADASSPEQPAHVFPYPRAGRDNAVVRLYAVDVDGNHRVELLWDRDTFPYLARVLWAEGAPPTLLVQSRDQRIARYLRADPKSGKTTLLHEERDAAWINLGKTTPRWVDARRYLFQSEVNGGPELHLHEPHLGKKEGLKSSRVVVSKEAGFSALVHVDPARGWIWFLGGPKPSETHLYRAPLAGDGPIVQVSAEGGEHDATFSPDGARYLLTRSTLTQMPRSTIYSVDATQEMGTLSVTAHDPKEPPRVELLPPERAGGFYAAVVRPRDFDPRRKYPVLLYVYGGPGFSLVKSSMAGYFTHQYFADHGFVVLSLDGRGTPRRGREWERALKGEFGQVPLEDQVKGLHAVAGQLPELDLSRVGIYGWSFGGYLAALSVLKRPDVFKVGVAGAPVVDWQYYDTHYTERYLDTPQAAPGAYERSSLLPLAKGLERPLLLVHGIADDNVYFAHTLQLADALFRAGRPYELLPLVRLTHQVADPAVRETLYQRMVKFLGASLW